MEDAAKLRLFREVAKYFYQNFVKSLYYDEISVTTGSVCDMANRDTYKYELRRGNKVVYVGITNDLELTRETTASMIKGWGVISQRKEKGAE